MFSKDNYKSTRNLEPKRIILNEKLASLARKIDYHFSTGASTFPCFQITWITLIPNDMDFHIPHNGFLQNSFQRFADFSNPRLFVRYNNSIRHSSRFLSELLLQNLDILQLSFLKYQALLHGILQAFLKIAGAARVIPTRSGEGFGDV